jgi:hypothetical protein
VRTENGAYRDLDPRDERDPGLAYRAESIGPLTCEQEAELARQYRVKQMRGLRAVAWLVVGLVVFCLLIGYIRFEQEPASSNSAPHAFAEAGEPCAF